MLKVLTRKAFDADRIREEIQNYRELLVDWSFINFRVRELQSSIASIEHLPLAGDKMLAWEKELNELQRFRLPEIRNRIEAQERSWRATPKNEFPELLIEMNKLQV